jgi:hypothetical protein
MDSKALFLTANADTVLLQHNWSDEGSHRGWTAAKGAGDHQRHVVRVDHRRWFSRSRPRRRRKVPPSATGLWRPAPDGGFYVARSKTTRVIYAARAFLTDNDPKPTVELIKKIINTPGGVGTSIATALDGKVRLEATPPVPATKFVEASGKSFNTIPPSDYSFFEMINANIQQEPADSYNPELAGQLAAIGIVKGKPFNPDARMRKILTDAAAVGNAAGRALNWRPRESLDWTYYPNSSWANMLWQGGANFETPPPTIYQGGLLQTLAADRSANPRLENGILLRLHPRRPGHDHAASAHRFAISHGISGRG